MAQIYVNLIKNNVRTLEEVLANPNISKKVKDQIVALLEKE